LFFFLPMKFLHFLLTVSSVGYVVGCFLLIPASVLLYFTSIPHWSISLFILATLMLTISALIDLFWFSLDYINSLHQKIEEEPIYNQENFTQNKPKKPFDWRTFLIVIFYCLGGFLFLLGSILFWPDFPNHFGSIGVWVFRFGSITYILGTFLVFYSIENVSWKLSFKLLSLFFYFCGSLIYILGGILSQMNFGVVSFSTAWLIGSISFFLGAVSGLVNHVLSSFLK
jgi:hypothetical protein